MIPTNILDDMGIKQTNTQKDSQEKEHAIAQKTCPIYGTLCADFAYKTSDNSPKQKKMPPTGLLRYHIQRNAKSYPNPLKSPPPCIPHMASSERSKY